MYSIRRDPHHSYYYSQYWSVNQQQQQQVIFHNRQMVKTKQQYFWSTKIFHNNNNNYDTMKSLDMSNSQDVPLPVYRAPCTFQNSCKEGYVCGSFRRSPLSSTSSASCVPDVYSPGPTSSGNCSPPPPSSNLPPPPSEWLD